MQELQRRALLRAEGPLPARQPARVQPQVLPALGAALRRLRAAARPAARRHRRARRGGVPAVPERAPVTRCAGLVLALGSAFALNWGWLAQHGAARELPALSLARARSARCACCSATARWLVGFLVGRRRLGALRRGARARSAVARPGAPRPAGSACSRCSPTGAATRSHRADWLARRPSRSRASCCSPSRSPAARRRRPRAGAGSARRSGSLVLLALVAARRHRSRRRGLGIAAGSLYAAGDVATKAGRLRRPLASCSFPSCSRPTALAFVAMQLGFQRGDALDDRRHRDRCSRTRCRSRPASCSSTSTCRAARSAMLRVRRLRARDRRGGAARAADGEPQPVLPCVSADDASRSPAAQLCTGHARRNVLLVGPSREARRARRAPARRRRATQRLDVPPLVEHVGREREIEPLVPRLAPVAHLGLHVEPVACGVLAQQRRSHPSAQSVAVTSAPRAAATSDGDTEPAAELDDAQAATRRAAPRRARARPARARPSTGRNSSCSNASSSISASGASGRSSASSTSPTRSRCFAEAGQSSASRPTVRPGGSERDAFEREQHAGRTPRARSCRGGSSAARRLRRTAPPGARRAPAAAPSGSARRPPIRSAVALAVPDGLSTFVADAARRSRPAASSCDACSAKRIISTAPSAKFGA